ncbi:helicase-related protein [Actinomycetospora atypica]|uniref:Helicase-related protein n=1 Tax=Actinomycetospora atypica TaxID=1290095 RepID=A0ABV9YEB8_9PSEU
MKARDHMENELRRELFGPIESAAPLGRALDISTRPVLFQTWEEARGPWHDEISKQEILTETDPLRRYGVGILFPRGRATDSVGDKKQQNVDEVGPSGGVEQALIGVVNLPTNDDPDVAPTSAEIVPRQLAESADADSDDFDLSDANSFQPSAQGLSFRLDLQDVTGTISIRCSGAYYEAVKVSVAASKKQLTWWVRRPVVIHTIVDHETIKSAEHRLVTLNSNPQPPAASIVPQIALYARKRHAKDIHGSYIVTVAVINSSKVSGAAGAFFQAGFEVVPSAKAAIEAYPARESGDYVVEESEELSQQLLYRHKQPYAVGHGCAAAWDDRENGPIEFVRADPLPVYEVPSLTPDITVTGADGDIKKLQVSMRTLAYGIDDGSADREVEQLLAAYKAWIESREAEIGELSAHLQSQAMVHMQKCRDALARMESGWSLVQTDNYVRTAFCRANEAMLLQQVRSRLPLRAVRLDKNRLFQVDGQQPVVDPMTLEGYWRPFQIAFILTCLEEIVYPHHPNREIVELIFFPTGGGKTEAYLGAAAISLISRRLRDPADGGTDVIMRYTLRLLTAQQFVRAASLICVLENQRLHYGDMGMRRISIGIWLGGDSTPNTHRVALETLKRLRTEPSAENRFLLLRCPWCGARMGPIASQGTKRNQEMAGYSAEANKKVRLHCPDADCDFSGRRGLPVYVIDEDIYLERPSLVIGTVDKFAMLAWRPEARAIFGLGNDGSRAFSPPTIIIQDELHLISGPLGSMVGLYESVIEDLCTDRRDRSEVKPKIIASTATIRQFERQVRDLYGRTRTALFPPHGLEEGHSFFAEPARLPDGRLAPGRRYLGVLAPALGSIQSAQVRVGAASLQAVQSLPPDERDPYWTNLNFLNSLRELGNTVSLLQSDIPDYLQGVWRRDGLERGGLRNPRNVLELTSRRRSDEIPKAIEELSLTYGKDGCVDVCLASNIIEVGVDIDRLSLMTIVGQPKTTAQYIQVSGRVGRKWAERPGLVVTIYAPSRPRDRSHFERFAAYHQRLYAQVEPTSLTPFSPPVLQRAFVGALLSYIRQQAPINLVPDPYPSDWVEAATKVLRERAALSDPDELASFDRVASQRAEQWKRGERTEWDASDRGSGNPLQGLMRFPGVPPMEGAGMSWEVPTSMRSVDSECMLRITSNYTLSVPSAHEGDE